MNDHIEGLIRDLEHAEVGNWSLDSRFGAMVGRNPLNGWTRDIALAMSAVPNGWAIAQPFRFKLEQKPVDSGPAWICEIRRHGEDGGHGIGYGAALAICAAVLRLHQRIAKS